MTELSSGYQPPYVARLHQPDAPELYLGLGHRPHDLIAPGVWQQANQDRRWALVREHVPGAAELTSDMGRAHLVGHLAGTHAHREAVDAYIARDRMWRHMHALGEREVPEFADFYTALPDDDTPYGRAAYDRWSNIWRQVLTEADTKDRGILPWDALLVMSWSDDKEAQRKARADIDQMTPDERGVLSQWMMGRDELFAQQAKRLHEGWALPWDNNWQGKEQNAQHWDAYGELSVEEQVLYKRWLISELLMQTSIEKYGQAQVPIDILYDVWRNTGRGESTVWQGYLTATRLADDQREAVEASFKNLDIFYLIEPGKEGWGFEYSRALEKMKWDKPGRDSRKWDVQFAEYSSWENRFMESRGIPWPYMATPRYRARSSK